MFTLTDQDFPLRAMGMFVYGMRRSSPLLTASSPAIAERTAFMMNECQRLTVLLHRNGVVTLQKQAPGSLQTPAEHTEEFLEKENDLRETDWR